MFIFGKIYKFFHFNASVFFGKSTKKFILTNWFFLSEYKNEYQKYFAKTCEKSIFEIKNRSLSRKHTENIFSE